MRPTLLVHDNHLTPRTAAGLGSYLFSIFLLIGLLPVGVQAQLVSLPAQPWPVNPVTVSFAPDTVPIGRYRNELFQQLNGQLSFPDWQLEILRAFQAWARHSNLQIAVAEDSLRAFGVPGLAQGDPRFGDVRIGAFPQEQVLGNAVPFNYAAGTWAGDVFLDANRQFYIHTGDTNSFPSDQYDLFSVMLHEAGNVLGLVDEELDIDSVMFFAYAGPRQELALRDILNIQMLYGPPTADPFENTGANETFAQATPIVLPQDFAQTKLVTLPGRVQHAADIDVYRLEGTALAENCWVKLRARGRSLLCGRITAYDEQFQEVATVSAEHPLLNTVGKELTNIAPGEVIYIAIDWSGVPDFEFGDYELALDFNPNGGEELERLKNLDGDDDDDDGQPTLWFEQGDQALVDWLYDAVGLIDSEVRGNDSFARAWSLFSPSGTPAGTRFEVVSALATPEDRDTFRIVTAANATGTLSLNLVPLGSDPASINVLVFDANQQRILDKRHWHANGDLTLEVNNVQPGMAYYVRVLSRLGNTQPGNYLLTVDVATASSQLAPIELVELSATAADQFASLTTYKTQLFQFALSMQSADAANQGCQLTIYNANGRVELATSVLSRRTRTAFVWLPAGTHIVRFTAQARSNRAIANSIVTLRGAAASDDEGPILIDPSGNPISDTQEPTTDPPPPPDWHFPILAILDLILPVEFEW